MLSPGPPADSATIMVMGRADTPAHSHCVPGPGKLQRPLPDAEIDGAEVLLHSPGSESDAAWLLGPDELQLYSCDIR
jgi:hypothetical protein